MYTPAHFSESRPAVLAELIRHAPLGLLCWQAGDDTLQADSVPFLLDDNTADRAGGPGVLRAHVARANPLWREARGDRDALVVFQGPQAYVSPSWYPSKAEHGKVVPTWNYIMVQARGRLRAVDDAAWVRALVGRLTDRQEAGRAAPWAVDDAPAPFVTTMLEAIVGIEIVLSELTGKWKVSQNRSAADRAGVADGLARDGIAAAEALARGPRAADGSQIGR